MDLSAVGKSRGGSVVFSRPSFAFLCLPLPPSFFPLLFFKKRAPQAKENEQEEEQGKGKGSGVDSNVHFLVHSNVHSPFFVFAQSPHSSVEQLLDPSKDKEQPPALNKDKFSTLKRSKITQMTY